MSKEDKVFKTRVTMPVYIHWKCKDAETAIDYSLKFFIDKEEVRVTDVHEVNEGDIDPDLIFDWSILPTHTVH